MLNNQIECKLKKFWLPVSSVKAIHRIGFNYAQPPSHMGLQRVGHDWLSAYTLTFLSILTNTRWFSCFLQGLRMRTETKVWNRKCLVWLVYLNNWHWCPLGHWIFKFLSSFMGLFGDHIHTCIYVHILSHISWDFLLGPHRIHWCYILWVSAYDLVSDF